MRLQCAALSLVNPATEVTVRTDDIPLLPQYIRPSPAPRHHQRIPRPAAGDIQQ